jgi:hypothetical protein
MVLAMIVEYNLPLRVWGEAINYAVYIINHVPFSFSNNGYTPFEVINGSAPNLSCLRVFGSSAYALITPDNRKKLDHTSVKGILLVYI